MKTGSQPHDRFSAPLTTFTPWTASEESGRQHPAGFQYFTLCYRISRPPCFTEARVAGALVYPKISREQKRQPPLKTSDGRRCRFLAIFPLLTKCFVNQEVWFKWKGCGYTERRLKHSLGVTTWPVRNQLREEVGYLPAGSYHRTNLSTSHLTSLLMRNLGAGFIFSNPNAYHLSSLHHILCLLFLPPYFLPSRTFKLPFPDIGNPFNYLFNVSLRKHICLPQLYIAITSYALKYWLRKLILHLFLTLCNSMR